jgi:hypothetical protein
MLRGGAMMAAGEEDVEAVVVVLHDEDRLRDMMHHKEHDGTASIDGSPNRDDRQWSGMTRGGSGQWPTELWVRQAVPCPWGAP